VPIDRTKLTSLIETIDEKLAKHITVVAVGGTALTLLKVKTSTIDIDFSFPNRDIDEFKKALVMLPKLGYKIDFFSDGDVFGITLPDDYLGKSIPIKKFKRIELRALYPIDIVVTKIGRLNQRDKQDIEDTVRFFGLSESQIADRAGQLVLAASEEQYKANLCQLLNAIFHPQRN
jgi:hypothetical protein